MVVTLVRLSMRETIFNTLNKLHLISLLSMTVWVSGQIINVDSVRFLNVHESTGMCTSGMHALTGELCPSRVGTSRQPC